jgi:hypothetical protein
MWAHPTILTKYQSASSYACWCVWRLQCSHLPERRLRRPELLVGHDALVPSRGRCSHLHAPLYIVYRESLRDYTGWCVNAFTAGFYVVPQEALPLGVQGVVVGAPDLDPHLKGWKSQVRSRSQVKLGVAELGLNHTLTIVLSIRQARNKRTRAAALRCRASALHQMP